MREAQELCQPTAMYYAQPLDDNLFDWHFTVRGPKDTPFQDGIYHGRILLPTEYPMKPPNFVLLTPNGRFQVGKKVCLSISGHHPESWQPSWSIRTALLALISFLPSKSLGAIGGLEYTAVERRELALSSRQWRCTQCGPIACLLLPHSSPEQPSLSPAEQCDGASAGSSDSPPVEQSISPAQTGSTQTYNSFWTSDTLIVVILVALAALICRRMLADGLINQFSL